MDNENYKAPQAGEDIGTRERITILYDKLVSLVSCLPNGLTSDSIPEIKRMRRLVQYVIDMVMDDEQILLAMALNSKKYDYAKRHCVNVCILSIKLGYHIGLSKRELADLGLIALLYDICLPFVPREVREKSGVYSSDDWREMERHTIEGFKLLFGMKDLDESLIRTAIVAYEHHMRYDMSGYPRSRHLPSQDFYTRIIAVAEWYDALTSARSYAKKGRSPDYAIKVMLEKAGTELDPALVKAFISMMGVYPVGSLVVLDSGEIGIVKQPHKTLIKRPRVIVISDKVRPYVVDLSRRGEDGRYLMSVKRTLDPNEYKIDYSCYFFSKPRRDM